MAWRQPNSYVFLFVTIAGLVMAYARADPPLSTVETTWLLLLTLVYLLGGTVVFHEVLASTSITARIVYLAFQIILGTLILYLGRGNGWLLMLPLASHSVALFSPREAVLPCVLITLAIAWNTSQMLPTWIPFLQSALVFGSAVFFAAAFTNLTIREVHQRERIERLAAQLQAANTELQAYAARIEELSAAQERNRLAREIHDGLGHYLTAMSVQASLVATMLEQDPQAAGEALAKMQTMLQEALAEVRRSVAALRSDPILGKSLPDALQPLLAETVDDGLSADLFVQGELRSLSPAHELTLYRAVQEGLTNVRKHAHARRVVVVLAYRPQAVSLRIQDDGDGSSLDPERLDQLTTSFGLFGLRERVQLLGGDLVIHTAPGQGFSLEITIPYGSS